MKNFIVLCLLGVIINFGATAQTTQDSTVRTVKITTSFGQMTAILYNETPIHRDNFISLADSGFFDSTLFHRVIDGFMIQGGDPDSKVAGANSVLGNGGPGYTLPAEIVRSKTHKKGVLAAARNPDNINPEFRSNGSQFYIVEGSVMDSMRLMALRQYKNNEVRVKAQREFFNLPENLSYKERLKKYSDARDEMMVQQVYDEVNPLIEDYLRNMPQFIEYTQEEIEQYKSVGGTPHLDGSYTVFGELVSGFEVLDSISSISTGLHNRPVRDIWMIVELVD